MKENIVKEKSYDFSLRIIKLYRYLIDKEKEFVLSKQILKCGTSIGANIEEAIGGQSKKDFISKICIAYKEARECHYWIRLLRDSSFIDNTSATSLLNDCDELVKLTGKIISSSKKTQDVIASN